MKAAKDMERRTRKDDYFKQTTRRIMSDAEKRRLYDVVIWSIDHFNATVASIRHEGVGVDDLPQFSKNFKRQLEYLDRTVNLVKGSTQPRHLYNDYRHKEIANEADRIARETGSEFVEVYTLFLDSMEEFVSVRL